MTNNTNDNNKCCYLCNTTEPASILHYTHHINTSYLHLCTNCILRTNPSLFCSLCLTPFPPSSSSTTPCIHCPAAAHLSCTTPHEHPFICPSCLDPTSTFFSTHKKNVAFDHDDDAYVVGDLRSARALVCAAIISAGSMTRAAAAARVEAERRVYEAVLAKKRATKALESFAVLFDVEEEGGGNGNAGLDNGNGEDTDTGRSGKFDEAG